MQLTLHPLKLPDRGRLGVLQGLHGLLRALLMALDRGFQALAVETRGGERFARFG